MGDRCYVEVWCRPQDIGIFEEIGFIKASAHENFGIQMVDEEANGAHFDELPKDIPYFGNHGDGCSYGPHEFACDGNRFMDWEVGKESSGYMINFNNDGDPLPFDITNIKEFFAVQERAKSLVRKACSPDAIQSLIGEDFVNYSLTASQL